MLPSRLDGSAYFSPWGGVELLVLTVALLASRSRPVAGLIVLRGTESNSTGSLGWIRAWLVAWVVRWLRARRLIYLAVDTMLLQQRWQRITGQHVNFVPPPARFLAVSAPKPVDAPILFGLLGPCRAEKGTQFYGTLIDLCVLRRPDWQIAVHLPELGTGNVPGPVRTLAETWSHVAGITVVPGVLNESDYERLFRDIDILILPYDVKIYGERSSGLMTESLTLHKIVVATRWPWAIARHGTDQNVVWLERTDRAALLDGLERASLLATAQRRAPPPTATGSDGFDGAWRDAVSVAVSDLTSRPQNVRAPRDGL